MIDLHAHTTFSDGSLSPTQLVELAARIGLSALAITDHDTVDGLPEALAAGERLGVEIVPGVEINLEHELVSMDMLGYFLNGPPSDELKEELVELRRYRDERNARIVERLAEIGLPLGPNDLLEAAGQGAVGRPHIALAMVRRGYAASVPEAFRDYLRRGAPAYVDRRRLSMSAALRMLQASGGIGVIAHPGLIDTSTAGLAHILRAGAKAGLSGLECHHPAHDDETIRACVQLAARFGLAVTGGSDFHGSAKPEIRLGRGPGGMPIPQEFLDDLRARALCPTAGSHEAPR
jgi:hypothetical protein